MKKIVILTLFLFFTHLTSFAKNYKGLIKDIAPVNMIVDIHEKRDNTKLTFVKYVYREYLLTCGNSVQYFPPAGESCTNIINALININNSVCGTSIPQVGAIFCGAIAL